MKVKPILKKSILEKELVLLYKLKFIIKGEQLKWCGTVKIETNKLIQWNRNIGQGGNANW